MALPIIAKVVSKVIKKVTKVKKPKSDVDKMLDHSKLTDQKVVINGQKSTPGESSITKAEYNKLLKSKGIKPQSKEFAAAVKKDKELARKAQKEREAYNKTDEGKAKLLAKEKRREAASLRKFRIENGTYTSKKRIF